MHFISDEREIKPLSRFGAAIRNTSDFKGLS
jgi:hypothetical protein